MKQHKMLDQETKHKIDSARDILVGKVPDPKAQVEQITIALIYKLMDEMDKGSKRLGGELSFFRDGLEKYSWDGLLNIQLSGQERLDLYMEAILEISKCEHIDVLFRNIFKDAFLPYRDPATLSLFLKEIDGFNNRSSEDLGNAFEYLLSIMSSQGDAGQFRTPRHIIDFIVAVVNPQKSETILDPACGTAGFLISAYKHILKNHDGIDNKTGKPTDKEKRLSSSARQKLANNLVGYDISPDMVKLSLVNMYLHGFKTPKIYEYDTLTSENRWEEQFDVILANPPFMSPKGGIRPHSRFSIQAKRSEVLFVDYILEHLNIKGRAGVIVPEGIIFKAEKAYKELRKMLLEGGLFAVVSLPSGVFNPYSGVKTSILFFDNQFAKKVDEILFIQIKNDGFDLGAQRRTISENDLPEALEVMESWGGGAKSKESKISLWVPRQKVLENADYNLTGEHYREAKTRNPQKWSLVELGEVCEILNGYSFKSKNYKRDGIRIIRISNVQKGRIVDNKPKFYSTSTDEKIAKYHLEENDILLSLTGNVGRVALLTEEFLPAVLNQRVACLRGNSNKIVGKYLFYLLNSNNFEAEAIANANGIAQKNLSTNWLRKYKIPFPPIEVQQEIIEQIAVKEDAINHAKGVIKSLERERRYFGQDLRKLEDIEWVELGEVAEIASGNSAPQGREYFLNGASSFVRTSDLGKVHFSDCFIGARDKVNEKAILDKKLRLFPAKTILLPKSGASTFLNHRAVLGEDAYVSSHLACVITDETKALSKFIYNILCQFDMRDISANQNYPSLKLKSIEKIKIPLPSIEIQRELVAEVEKEEKIISANFHLIELMEERIEEAILSSLP